MKCIFDPVYFHIITSLCQFFSIIFAFITKSIKLCCENQGFWHIRKISCQKRCKIRVDPILGAAFIQIQIILHFHCSKHVLTVKSKEEERMAESMSEQIFSIACALSKADESEKSMLRMICTAQEESLVRALKEGVAKEDCESAFICAASWLAAAAMESARAGGEEFSSLRAGDLTVTKRSSDEGSKRLSLLREQAWALMRPYTTDGGFCFRGVEA